VQVVSGHAVSDVGKNYLRVQKMPRLRRIPKMLAPGPGARFSINI
jgi:hypothetical protein